ncbi:AAA family ATPase [Sporosarcina soli]|uniref:AAA family ATPase n=1 Tax=Sporosarcina soli TaxID=334736 RepID=A0ABW0TRK6_9BACL
MGDQLFPTELLLKSANERISYFKNFTIAHPKLKSAFKEFEDNISVANKNEILLIFGPSGVGKSTLFNKIINHYNKIHKEDMIKDKGFVPIVGLEAIAPDDGRFDWKDFYIRSLGSLYEPLINQKKILNAGELSQPLNSKNAYRRAMENALIYRRPRAFLIDEAQHLSRVARGRSLRNQMDILKSLASVSMVPFVLFGTYEILKFRNLSGQLIRRGMDVHFPRYKAEIEDDREAFQNILWTFQKHLPFNDEPNLVENWEYFYIHSVGCVGNLKIWFNRTVEYSLLNNQDIKTLDLCDFKKFEVSLDKIEKMADESIEMEKHFEDMDSECKKRVLMKFGFDTKNDKQSQKNEKQRGKVGERKPNRDHVGFQ